TSSTKLPATPAARAREQTRATRSARRSGDRREMVVHGTHRARPLSDRGRHPLQRATPHVTDREDAGYGRFERQRSAGPEERTVRDCCRQGAVREDEALRVELQRTSQPRGGGIRADEAEQAGAVDRPPFPGPRL